MSPIILELKNLKIEREIVKKLQSGTPILLSDVKNAIFLEESSKKVPEFTLEELLTQINFDTDKGKAFLALEKGGVLRLVDISILIGRRAKGIVMAVKSLVSLGLAEQIRRGTYKITSLGKKVIALARKRKTLLD